MSGLERSGHDEDDEDGEEDEEEGIVVVAEERGGEVEEDDVRTGAADLVRNSAGDSPSPTSPEIAGR